jgi:hypothetical protein
MARMLKSRMARNKSGVATGQSHRTADRRLGGSRRFADVLNQENIHKGLN